jgi:hypothetical protein
MLNAIRAGRTAGVLLIVLLGAGLMTPYILLHPVNATQGAFLEQAPRLATLLRFCVLMMLLANALPIAISVATWPFVRERGRVLKFWVLALAATNFAMQIVENSHWMTLLSLGLAHAEAAAPVKADFALVARAAQAAWKWAHYSHILIVVSWLFAFFLLLVRARLMPVALPAIAMVFCVMQFTGITLPAFAGIRNPFATAFGMPLAFGILAVAGWLLTMGFREAGGASQPVHGPMR